MFTREKSKVVVRHTCMPHYQVYYWTSLQNHVPVSVAGGPWWYRVLPFADLGLDVESVYERLSQQARGANHWDATKVDQFVAEYRYINGDKVITFAIDAHDGKEIFSPDLLERCDIYFKANMWKSETYDRKVRPLVNGNGFLRKRHLRKLKEMRSTEKSNDFLFISRIWGGVEHNIRLFEELSTLQCQKRLVAVFVRGAAGEEETTSAIRRLESVGVHCTFDLLPIKKLWEEIVSTKVVMLRAGKYMCIPWRMIDLLCLGTCIVSDSDFEPQWPIPLEPGVHYTSAGITRPSDTSAAPAEQYYRIRETVQKLLKDDKRIARMQIMTADYYDDYAAPDKVGKYILDTLRGYMEGKSIRPIV